MFGGRGGRRERAHRRRGGGEGEGGRGRRARGDGDAVGAGGGLRGVGAHDARAARGGEARARVRPRADRGVRGTTVRPVRPRRAARRARVWDIEEARRRYSWRRRRGFGGCDLDLDRDVGDVVDRRRRRPAGDSRARGALEVPRRRRGRGLGAVDAPRGEDRVRRAPALAQRPLSVAEPVALSRR